MDVDLRQSGLDYIRDKADTKFLEMVYSLSEEYQEAGRIGLEQYKQELDESIAQIEKREFYTHQEVGERISKWSKK